MISVSDRLLIYSMQELPPIVEIEQLPTVQLLSR